MKVFDIHTHFFPDKIAADAIRHLEANSIHDKYAMSACFDGTRDGLIAHMKKCGITASLNLPVATSPEQIPGINLFAAKSNMFPVYSFGSIHPDCEDKRGALLQIKELGLKGIKMHPEYQQFSFDDERVQEIYEVCEELELIILFHCGFDCSFPQPFRSNPYDLSKVLNSFPKLKVIGGHFGGLDMWDDVENYLIGRDVYLEISFLLGHYPNEKVKEMLIKHDSDKLLFGSDAPWADPKETLDRFLKLNLSQTLRDKILWNNAVKLLGIDC